MFEDLGNCRKETAVKVEHAKEFLQRLNSVGGGKERMVEHGMGWDSGQTFRCDTVSREVNRRSSKGRFVRVDVETIFGKDRKDGKDLLQTRKVFLLVLGENEIIQIDEN
jgi:hypothetical protein